VVRIGPDAKRIGLIADSHGDFHATERAIRVLRERGADCLVHLGDFCDSVRNNGLNDLVRLLRDNNMSVVKGNNDYQVEKMLRGVADPKAGQESLVAFFNTIPMMIVEGEACFAHSLPYDALRAFYEPIDIGSPKRARKIFQHTSYRILFCGHSHLPVFFRWRDEEATRESIAPQQTLSLAAAERYIMIVGAVYEGESALYNREAQTYERITIF